jgi:hypothetical protein
MDGTNSVGRKVSLLNDYEPPHHLVRLNSFAPSLRSRTLSYDSSSVGSPPTPQLVRSNSSDSTSMQTPSPITPDFGFPTGGDATDFSQASFFPQQKEIFPHMYDIQGAIPYHPAHSNIHYQQQQPMDGAAPNAVQANGRPKKNQYPCPMAKAIGCKDHFTTSGHAARHAKKHTGKKDAVCPECNKAFTRKDNMEQHRRTHQSGRGAAKASDRDVKKAKLRTQAPRPKASPIQSQATTPTMPTMNTFDPALANSPTGSFSAVMPSESFVDYNQRTTYPDPSAYAMNTHSYMNGFAGGLDALASAASREQQNLEEESLSEDEQRHKRQRHQ